MDALLSPEEVAEQIGHVKAWTITAARRRQEIAATKVGKKFLFRVEDVEAWLQSRRTAVKAPGSVDAPTGRRRSRRSA
jgi:excisionase family DNA binding protein